MLARGADSFFGGCSKRSCILLVEKLKLGEEMRGEVCYTDASECR
jgi:hypothetical protein